MLKQNRIPMWIIDTLNDADDPFIDIHILREAEVRYRLLKPGEKP